MSWLRAIIGGFAFPSWVLPLVIVSAVVSSLGAAYVKGRMDSSANCREAQLLAELEAMKRDRQAAIEAERESDELAAMLAREKMKLEEELTAYEQELSTRPDDRCNLTDSDVKRMR